MNTHFFILLLLVAIQVRASDEADYKGHLLTFTKLLDNVLAGKKNDRKIENDSVSAITINKVKFLFPSKIIDASSLRSSEQSALFESFNKKIKLYLYAVDSISKEPLILDEDLVNKLIPMTSKTMIALADSIQNRTKSLLGCIPNYQNEMSVCSFRRKEENFFEADLLVQEKPKSTIYAIRAQSLDPAFNDIALDIQIQMSRFVSVSTTAAAPAPPKVSAPTKSTNYATNMAKLKQTTAKMKLAAMYAAESAFFAEFKFYTTDLEAVGIESQTSESKSAYICGFAKVSPASVKGYKAKLKTFQLTDFFKFPKDPRFTLTKHFTKDSIVRSDSFKISCVGNIDTDPELDIWTIDSKKNLINVKDDIN